MNEKGKKILNVIGDVVLIIIMIVAIVITVLTFSSKANNKGVANLLGYSPFSVQTDSMKGTATDDFDPGDLIIVKTKNFDPLSFKVGDIITFFAVDVESGETFINSHRIVKVEPFDETNSYMFYTTKGDNNEDNDVSRVGSSEIIGTYKCDDYTGIKIPHLGAVMDFLQTQTGFMICVVLPLALFFIWQVYKFFAILINNKKAKALEELNEMSEDEKKKIAEEYLKKQEEEKKAAELSEEEKKKIAEEYLKQQAQQEESSSEDSDK